MQLRNGIVWWIWLDLCDKHTKHTKSVDFFFILLWFAYVWHEWQYIVHWATDFDSSLFSPRIELSNRYECIHECVCVVDWAGRLRFQRDSDLNSYANWIHNVQCKTVTEICIYTIHSLGAHFWYVGQEVSSFSLVFILWGARCMNKIMMSFWQKNSIHNRFQISENCLNQKKWT